MATWKKIITSGSAAELSSLTLDTDLAVAHGGTGQGSYTDGQLLIGNTTGNTLAKATLTGTSNEITVTNGNGSITLSQPDDVTIGQDLTVTRNISNASAVSDSHLTGSFSGSFSGDGSNLTGTGFNIDELSNSLDSGSIATGDLFAVADVNDSNEEKKIPFEDVRDAIFEDVSSDATIAIGGALTIANDSVNNDKLANITRGSIKVGGGSNAPTDLVAKASGQILVGDGTDIASVAVSGDMTLAANGALTIDNNAVDNDAIDNTADVTLGSLTTTNNVTVGGDLTVNGTTTTIATANLDVEDQFIFLATGSAASNLDAGIVVQSGSSVDTGSAFYHDKTDQRWSVAKGVAKSHTGAAQGPTSFVTTVKTDTVNPDTTSGSYGAGEMHVNTTSGEIWIRFG